MCNGITLLKGIEVDILDDGALDLPDDVLGRLDLVVGAVHSRFELPREAQTRRERHGFLPWIFPRSFAYGTAAAWTRHKRVANVPNSTRRSSKGQRT